MKEGRFDIGFLKQKETSSSKEVAPEYRIIACVGSEGDFKSKDRAALRRLQKIEVDFYAEEGRMDQMQQRHAGTESYVISPIDSQDKYSGRFKNCIGVVAVGRDKKTGKNVSFLTHQSPVDVLERSKDSFARDFTISLREFASTVRPETIDIVIVGGNFFDNINSARTTPPELLYEGRKLSLADDFKDSIVDISKQIEEVLHIDPLVAVGPNMRRGHEAYPTSTSVWLNTKKRRLYIMRPEQKGIQNSISFRASKVEEVTKNWENSPDYGI